VLRPLVWGESRYWLCGTAIRRGCVGVGSFNVPQATTDRGGSACAVKRFGTGPRARESQKRSRGGAQCGALIMAVNATLKAGHGGDFAVAAVGELARGTAPTPVVEICAQRRQLRMS
jgi:hypothetical protein